MPSDGPTAFAEGELSPDHAEVELAELTDDVIPTRGYDMLPMVGLGGSAGSIQALQTFFRAMPADTGLAYVVILHLSSEHESSLAELLQGSTKMPVVQVNATAKVESDHVYVIPPGKQLASADGHLELADLPTERGRRLAVDLFFRTLADTHGPNAAAIVLSGADGDGTIGIKRIKERGGLTIAQDPGEAEHQGMPSSAISTGMVDWVLQVNQMPERLVKYYELRNRLALPPEEGPQPAQAPARRSVSEAEAALREVLAFLRARTGRDFSYYKRATILRRIGRRLQVNGIDDLPAYLEFLRLHPGETRALLQDMLISVTNFFRDREAFDALEAEIAALFNNKRATDSIRVWVPGCATGEEAYSLAMLLSEYARKIDASPQIQIFATDLDENVIRSARDGVYPDAIAADVSEERLRRWFVKEAHGYRVRREIRELVLFALHDVLKDSPFSRLDLVSCRNLLIYLTNEAQSRAFDIFHFALRPGGRLFLGTSESVENDGVLFSAIDKKYRIYAQRPSARMTLPVPFGTSALARALELKEKISERPALPKEHRTNGGALSETGALRESIRIGAQPEELHYKLIERFAPPSILVNGQYDIVHMSDHAGNFLQLSGGEPTRNLLQLIHPMLRLDLRAALFSAAQSQKQVDASNVVVDLNGNRKVVDLHVFPAGDLVPEHLLVKFDLHPLTPEMIANRMRNAELDEVSHQLELELERTKAQLRSTVEQSEASTEELKASNEELQAMNEELRSATEELETSREELQSINEELATVNIELKNKVEELGHSNSDLHVLMAATAIATIFLDRDLRILRYTPPAVELFNLIPTDMGRPLSDLTHRLDYPEIERDARRALGELVPSECEVQAGDRWFLARTLPYRTADDRIGGVVLTFVDVTERRHAVDSLRALQEEQAADLAATLKLQELSSRLLNSVELQPLLRQLLDATIEMQGADFGCVQLYNAEKQNLEMAAQRGFDPSLLDRFEKLGHERLGASGRSLSKRGRIVVADVNEDEGYKPLRAFAAQAGYRAVHSIPLFDRNDQPLGVLTTHFRQPHTPSEREIRLTDLYARQFADVIAFKIAEQTVRASEEAFRAIVEQTTLGVLRCAFSGRLIFVNQRLCEIVGHPAEKLYQLRLQEITHPDDLATSERSFARLARDGTPFQLEQRLIRGDGSLVSVSLSVSALRDRDGRPQTATAMVLDLTERNRALHASRESEERLRLVIENAREYAIFALDLDRRIASWNSGAQRLLGYSENEIVGQLGDIIFTPEDRGAGAPEHEAEVAFAEGRSADERWHVRKDGSRFWGSGAMMAMHDANNQTIGLLKIFRDETLARETNEALARSEAELTRALKDNQIARNELEAASRAKDRFLAVLSHELRTPLTPVVMAVQTLVRRKDIPEPAKEALEMIRRNVKIESHLIDDLLDLTRVTRGQFEVVTEPMDIHAAIEGAVEICESDIRGKDQTLTVKLEAQTHVINGDYTRLQQVVWNLLKNASKFTRRGGAIRLTTASGDKKFCVTVSDNGIGIDPNALPTIYEAFTQGGEWVSREYGGLGLGLAISRATIEAHGRSIKVESGG
ncbi:MAG TPA: CheR family methyltransferase, partial [Burkholderiaceae bacterium]|nr:CheR family methyltransferase [Burkholderiaceae bacterium]